MKKDLKESVLHDWVMELPFTQQALLMLATPDFTGSDGFMNIDYGIPYTPSNELSMKELQRCEEGWKFREIVKSFFLDVDSYPLHFYMHLVHAAEVIGYKYPEENIRILWEKFYHQACKNFHMSAETKYQLDNRLYY